MRILEGKTIAMILKSEDKLLNNSLLFSSIRKNKTSDEKIQKVKKYLDRGAEINATDANNKNNTPLHVAVIKGELEVVRFLLERGALANIKNSNNETALDIARLSDKSAGKVENIVNVLEAFNNDKLKQSCSQQELDTNLTKKSDLMSSKERKDPKYIQPVTCDTENQTQSSDVNNGSAVKNRKLKQKKPNQQQLNKQLKTADAKKTFCYQKRTGTSSLSGHLYKSKLLCLILFRALYVYKDKTFLIATNVDNMDAFNDIVFRFYLNTGNKPKILFVQATHKDNPEKDKFTVEEIIKSNGDFSLHKYLESYIKIIQMFKPEKNDDMFRGEFKDMDCEFIVYTDAFEKFTKKKFVEQNETASILDTSEAKRDLEDDDGHPIRTKIPYVFQFDYDDQDVDLLVQTVAKSRAVLLAKQLSKFIFKDNHDDMMMDDLIKTYHAFLARHILEVEIKEGESQNDFRYAKFRKSFFSSHDHLLLAFKSTISKIVSPEKPDQVESILMSQKFKVPLNFGNLNFCFSGNQETQENELDYLCSKFKQIFAKAAETFSANILMKVDDNMVGPNKILQSTDLESHGLGGLVGNLLVFDNVTKTLKFNFDVDTLSDDNLKLLEKLKSDVFIGIANKCRFNINIQHFPRLSLVHEENDKKLIKKFLCNLIFYTNQAKEDEVEKILKKEIDIYFVGGGKRQSIVKADAIFLKIHDRVQKWWQQPFSASYLTESCKYFWEAEQDILNSPLLSILNFTFTETIKNALSEIKFKNTALELLQLDGFFEGSEKILSIITEENALSSMKLMQYFEERNFNGYTFIDLDYVGIRNYFVDVKAEIKESKLTTLIVVCKSEDVADINLLIRHFAGKIIVISNRNLSNQIKRLATEDIVERVDNQIGFKDLADTMRTMLLEERYIVFQGKEIPLGILFKDESYYLINSQLLYMIINNKKITIGNFLNSPAYDEISDVYINEEVCRYITLDPSVQTKDQYSVVKYNELDDDFTPDTKDIVLVADNREEFCEFINTYGNCNVHWFNLVSNKYKKHLVWQESRGKLLNILNHVNRGTPTHSAKTLQPVTLKEVIDKVVIISAEPGMGKSSLLTHLAINTKEKYPALWISKVNLLEYTDVLKRIKESQTTIDLKEAMQFLFRVIGFKAFKDRRAEFEIIIDLVSVIGDDIVLKNKVELNVTGSNLFEIELFIYCYNNNRVVLLLDGFDEICPDFANELIQLVKIFKKSKVIHLWITSRLYNVLHQLENGLETFSFTIQPVSPENQLEFIKKMFLRKFGSNKSFPTIKGELDYVGHFRHLLGLVVEKNFLTIPLHLYMTSQLFQESYFNNSFDPEYVNLSKIYKLLVESKFFKIRFGEKKPLLCINDPDMRKLVDTERTAFLYAHKVMAAHVIFGETDEIQLYDTNDMNTLRDFIEEIKVGEEKTGIVERIIQDKAQFVHYTFAEYFAAEFLYDKLKSFQCRSSFWLYLINSFLQSERDGPLRFLDHKLENLQRMFDETYIADLHEMFESLLLERENLKKTLYSLIHGRSYNIAIILLKFVKAVLGKKNLKFFIDMVTDVHKSFYMYNCILCMTVQRRAKQVLTFIIKLINDIDDKRIIDIFDCSDFPRFSPLTDGGELRVSLRQNVELLDALMSNVSPCVLVDLLCQEITYNLPCDKEISIKMIHVFIKSWLKGDIDTEWFNNTFKKLNREQLMTIFSARDWQNRVAAHRVAMEQSYSIFAILESLLDRNQFKEICMTRDKAELTPLHYFNTKINGEQLRIILEKVYDGNPKENFVSRHDLMEERFKKYVQSLVIFGGTDEIQLFHAYDAIDITEIRDFIEGIKVEEEKTSLVEEIIQNKSKFDLYTFAKYIAVEFLCDELNAFRCRTSLWVYLINTFFQSEVDDLRMFFYAKLENHQLMFNEISNADLNKKFENLLSERQKLAQSLYKAIDSKLYNIAIILLKFVRDVLSKKNIDDFMDVLNNRCTDRCIVCIAVRNNAKDVVNFIIELIRSIDDNRIIDIFKCFDLPISNPLVVRGGLRKSLRQNVELLDALLSDLTASELVYLFCRDVGNYYTNTSSKIIHIFIKSWLQGFIDTEWFYGTLEKFNREQLMTIFTTSDSGKKVVAHIAALEQSYTFFDKLESLLDRNQFKEICKTPDIEGKTPMHNFSDTNCEKLKILLDKIYDGNAKANFVSRLDLLDINYQQRTKQKNSDTLN